MPKKSKYVLSLESALQDAQKNYNHISRKCSEQEAAIQALHRDILALKADISWHKQMNQSLVDITSKRVVI